MITYRSVFKSRVALVYKNALSLSLSFALWLFPQNGLDSMKEQPDDQITTIELGEDKIDRPTLVAFSPHVTFASLRHSQLCGLYSICGLR